MQTLGLLVLLLGCGDKGDDSGAAPGDGGASDGGASDGGVSDGGVSDGGGDGGADGGASDGGASDGGASDGGASDGGASDGGASDGGASDGGASDGRDAACAATVDAAQAFLASLDTDQLAAIQYAMDDAERRDWSNLPDAVYPRSGLYFRDLTAGQRKLLDSLLATFLSEQGVTQAQATIDVDQWWAEGGNDRLGEEFYTVVVFDEPSTEAPWGFQLDGHHMALSFMVSCPVQLMVPGFWGIEPEIVPTGDLAGLQPMADEVDRALALMESLDEEQAALALVDTADPRDLWAGAGADDGMVEEYEGIAGAELTTEQRALLLDLIGAWVRDQADPYAELRMLELEDGLDAVWFSWRGRVGADQLYYYRVHGPDLWIELDHAGVDHLHAVYRHPTDDYGDATLADHYTEFPHD